jgi:hypothetical protein
MWPRRPMKVRARQTAPTGSAKKRLFQVLADVPMASSENTLQEMEHQQDDVLARLDALNDRIEALLATESVSPLRLAIDVPAGG